MQRYGLKINVGMHSSVHPYNCLRQVLKSTFAVFLAFSLAGFAYFLNAHSALCFLGA